MDLVPGDDFSMVVVVVWGRSDQLQWKEEDGIFMIFIFVDIVHDAYGKGSSDLGALKVAIRILT